MANINRFVSAEVDRIHLTDGDWIEVKRDLNTGETKRLEACGMQAPIKLADGTMHTPIDWEVYEIERAAIFLMDWSFRDVDDKPVVLRINGKVSVDALKALDIETFNEINAGIMRHVLARADAKKAQREAKKETTLTPQSEPSSVSDQTST